MQCHFTAVAPSTDKRVFEVQGIDQTSSVVADELVAQVAARIGRSTVPPVVEGNDPELLGEKRHNVSPAGTGEKTRLDQDEGIALPMFFDVEADPIDVDVLANGGSACRPSSPPLA